MKKHTSLRGARRSFLGAVFAALVFTTASAMAEDAPPLPSPPAPAPVTPVAAVAAVGAGAPPKAESAPPVAPVAAGGPPIKPRLGDRVRAFMTANAGITQLQGQVNQLTAERDRSAGQVAALTTERDDLRRQLGEVEQALGGARNVVVATATEIAQTVGIPSGALPGPTDAEAAEKPTIAQLAAAVQAAKTPKDRMKAYAAWSAASAAAQG